MRLRLLVLVVALMLTAVSCDLDWLMLRFGPARTGFSPDTSISKDAVQSSMVLNWTAAIGGNVSSAAVANGVVYVGSDKLYAFGAAGTTNCSGSPTTCQPLWTAAAGGIVSSPAVAGGVVYVSSNDGTLYAFDAAGTSNCSGSPATCQPLWTAAGGLAVDSSPAVANGVVYVGSTDGMLYAFDAAGTSNCSESPKTCQPLWTAPTGGPVHSPPAVANGVVYVGSDDRLLYAFDAAGTTNCSGSPTNCAPLWTTTGAGLAIRSSPAVANGVVYVGADKLYAFDAAGTTNCSGSPTTCTPLWAATGAGGSPAVANGMVYATGGGALQAFDAAGTANCLGSPKTCQPLWTTGPREFTLLSSPAVTNGVVYVGSDDCSGPTCVSELWAVDAAGTTNCSGSPTNCAPLWKTGIDPASPIGASSPVVSHGAVLVASKKLYAFGLEKVAPTTSILIPSNGATLSGTATLDASASDNVKASRVEFRLTGGNYNKTLIGAATLTYYGWIYSWNTTTVPNGSYTLNSVAFDPAGNTGRSPNVNITVQNYPPPTAKLYLTFDDGPSTYTPQILSELEAGGARATFFVIGEHATQYPSYVQQEQAAGDEIGDHTWDHPNLTTLSPDQIRQELETTAEEIASLTRRRPTLWRPPYNRYNDTVIGVATSLGLSMRLYNIDPQDYYTPGADTIVSRVVDNVRDGDIVLLHDGGGDRSQTVEAVPRIIDTLRQRGYEFAMLDTTTSAPNGDVIITGGPGE